MYHNFGQIVDFIKHDQLCRAFLSAGQLNRKWSSLKTSSGLEISALMEPKGSCHEQKYATVPDP
jgi:hypothetical protein